MGDSAAWGIDEFLIQSLCIKSAVNYAQAALTMKFNTIKARLHSRIEKWSGGHHTQSCESPSATQLTTQAATLN